MESIYERIRAAVQPDGTLPAEFSVQPEPDDPKALHFVDGAKDGISFYHVSGRGDSELLEELTEITQRASAGAAYAEAGAALTACFAKREGGISDGMLGCIDDLQQWLVEHREELSPNGLFRFAHEVLLRSTSPGAVKYALSVLELLSSADDGWKEAVRTLALSDELALFCVFVIKGWENKDEELFAMAQKVKGWGRIHAVRELEPATREIETWLLDEGWDNNILPAYTALHCAQAGGLRRRLEGEPLSRPRLIAAGELIRGLLDEGPCQNISLMEDGEDLLLAWLDQVEEAGLNDQDRDLLLLLRKELPNRDWPRLLARLEGAEM